MAPHWQQARRDGGPWQIVAATLALDPLAGAQQLLLAPPGAVGLWRRCIGGQSSARAGFCGERRRDGTHSRSMRTAATRLCAKREVITPL